MLQRSGVEVVGEAANAEELLAMVRSEPPDLAVVDIRMPPTQTVEGLQAADVIRLEHPSVALLVLSAHVEVEHATTLLAQGQGVGYLLKSRVVDADEFVATVRRVAGGGAVIDPALVQELVSIRRQADPLEDLSPREREVLELMAQGRSNAGIGQLLWVTEGTVEKHVKSVMQKLRLHDTPADHRRVLAVIRYLEAR